MEGALVDVLAIPGGVPCRRKSILKKLTDSAVHPLMVVLNEQGNKLIQLAKTVFLDDVPSGVRMSIFDRSRKMNARQRMLVTGPVSRSNEREQSCKLP